MSEPESNESRATFAYLSHEYAQAVQAIQAIEQHAAMIITLGNHDELLTYVAQFVEMASNARALASERGETNFVEWFEELIARVEAVRGAILTKQG